MEPLELIPLREHLHSLLNLIVHSEVLGQSTQLAINLCYHLPMLCFKIIMLSMRPIQLLLLHIRCNHTRCKWAVHNSILSSSSNNSGINSCMCSHRWLPLIVLLVHLPLVHSPSNNKITQLFNNVNRLQMQLQRNPTKKDCTKDIIQLL